MHVKWVGEREGSVGKRRESKGQRSMIEAHLRQIDVTSEEYKIRDKSNRISDSVALQR